MSANAMAEDGQERIPQPATTPPPEGLKKTEYLVHTTVRTMLGNPSALTHGRAVVVRSDVRRHVMTEKQRKKEEKKRRKEEKKRLKQERKTQWEEFKRRRTEEAQKRAEEVAARHIFPTVQEVPAPTGEPMYGAEDTDVKWPHVAPIPDAIFCNSCGVLSYGCPVEYEYSVSSHLTAGFLSLCCCCWLPYLLRCCMDEVYYCSNCGDFLGKTSTLSRRNIF